MNENAIPSHLGIIAGRGVYPLLLAESARQQGVQRLSAVAFRHETDSAMERRVDDTTWVTLGQVQAMLDAVQRTGARHVVMVGLLTPTHLFRVRPDAKGFAILRGLKARNADTIYGAVVTELAALGITVLPAHRFMEAHMPEAGVLSARPPTEREQADIELGVRVARTTSGLDIGQTVVIKEGTIVAVEAFEGTDATILRAGGLAGAGLVIVKVAKDNHDMRFDIPVIGTRTMKVLKKVKASALAVQAGRAIILEREKVLQEADRLDLAVVAL